MNKRRPDPDSPDVTPDPQPLRPGRTGSARPARHQVRHRRLATALRVWHRCLASAPRVRDRCLAGAQQVWHRRLAGVPPRFRYQHPTTFDPRRHRNASLLLATVCLLPLGCQSPAGPSRDPAAGAVVYIEETFQLDEPGDAWVFRTPSLWTIAVEGDRRMLRMAPPPDRPMLPGVPRPQEYAVYGRHRFRSFNLSCRVRIDDDPGAEGRDVCLIFGRQDERHFYYLHLSNVSDPFRNALVRIDGDTRTSLTPPGHDLPPAVTGRDWHKIDIQRDADTGLIAIYVDAYDPDDEPWLEVHDRTYTWGHIGFGSVNSHASLARLLIEGETD